MDGHIKKIYYWNNKLQTYLPCVWNKTFECYTPDLQKKIKVKNSNLSTKYMRTL